MTYTLFEMELIETLEETGSFQFLKTCN
jgi:hypothetical protein